MANCTRCGRQLPPFSFKKICQWCVQYEAAQRGEDRDEVRQRVMPAPWVRRESTISLTKIIFGANLAVFLAMALASRSIEDFPGSIAITLGANYGPDTLSGQWWRLFTYMFLHGGVWHILFNMWCLWDLGALCESLYGRWTYGAIYLITGVAGGLASVAWNPGVLSVGASGAIFGLAGALAASFYLGEFSMPRIALQPTLRSLAFFIGFNVLFGIGYNVFLGGSFGYVDNACHAGGLVSGAILGALIARLAPQRDAPARRAAIVGLVAVVLLAGGFGVRQWRGRAMRTALAYRALTERGDSVAALQMIIKQQPNLVPAHMALAGAYVNKQQLPQAEAEYKKVLELNPNYSPAKVQLGMTYLNENKADEAKALFAEMLAKDPNSAAAHYGLGLALSDQQKYDEAIAEFKTASASDITGVYFDMGNTYAKLKKYDDAIASYQKEKEKSGDDPNLESALAEAYEAKGMKQQAEEARARAAKLMSGQQ